MTRLINRLVLVALPLAALAACGGGDANSSTPADPVAAVAPPAGQDWTQIVSKTADGGHLMGNPDAPIKLLEYGSRTCPTCGAFGREGVQPLEENYIKTGKVSYEFRDFMVHAPDIGVATLGTCVSDTAFFPILEQMYQNQLPFLEKLEGPEAAAVQQKVAGAKPTEAAAAWAEFLGYIDFVKQRGVTEQQARACLNDPKHVEAISQMTQHAAQDLGVTGTPSFFINGRQLANTLSWAQLEPQLKAAGAR